MSYDPPTVHGTLYEVLGVLEKILSAIEAQTEAIEKLTEATKDTYVEIPFPDPLPEVPA